MYNRVGTATPNPPPLYATGATVVYTPTSQHRRSWAAAVVDGATGGQPTYHSSEQRPVKRPQRLYQQLGVQRRHRSDPGGRVPVESTQLYTGGWVWGWRPCGQPRDQHGKAPEREQEKKEKKEEKERKRRGGEGEECPVAAGE